MNKLKEGHEIKLDAVFLPSPHERREPVYNKANMSDVSDVDDVNDVLDTQQPARRSKSHIGPSSTSRWWTCSRESVFCASPFGTCYNSS